MAANKLGLISPRRGKILFFAAFKRNAKKIYHQFDFTAGSQPAHQAFLDFGH